MRRWMQIALVMSLAFNLGFLGAFVYRLTERQPVQQMIQPHVARPQNQKIQPHEPVQPVTRPVLLPEQKHRLQEIRQAFQPGIRQIRQELMKEKRALGDMLFMGETDSLRIDSQIRKIGELEMRMEKTVIFELLRESRIMTPEERPAFIRMALKRIEGNRQRPQQRPLNRTERGLPPRQPDRQKQRRNPQ